MTACEWQSQNHYKPEAILVEMPTNSFLKYYDLESYLFDQVSQRFAKGDEVDAFDFFCIVIWKANRSKSRIANRLLEKGFTDLEIAVRELIGGIREAESRKDRMKLL